MRPGNNVVQCRNCNAREFKRKAVELGWYYVKRNAWQCSFCALSIDEPVPVRVVGVTRAHACLVNHISTDVVENVAYEVEDDEYSAEDEGNEFW